MVFSCFSGTAKVLESGKKKSSQNNSKKNVNQSHDIRNQKKQVTVEKNKKAKNDENDVAEMDINDDIIWLDQQCEKEIITITDD